MIQAVANHYRKAFSGLPIEVWYLATVVLVNRSGSMVLPFLALYVSDGLGLGESAAGWMLMLYGLGSCSGSFVGGLVTDRVGPFRVQILSLIVSGVGYMLMSRADSFASLATIVLFTSFAADIFRPANAASVTLLAPAELHNRAFSLNRLAINLGYTVGPTVGGVLATVSYQFLFFIDGLTSFIAAATFIYFLGFHAPSAETALRSTDGEPTNVISLAPWKNTRFMLFLLFCFATFSVFFQLISTFPLFLKSEYQLSKIQIGTLFGVNTLGVVAFEMVLVLWLERRNIMRLIAWGSLLMCLGFGLLPFGYGYWFALATILVWTLGEMLAMPQMLVYVAQVSNWSNRSVYMGCYTTCVALAMMVGPLVGTYLYQWDRQNCWHFATLIGLVVLAGFYCLDIRQAKTQSEK